MALFGRVALVCCAIAVSYPVGGAVDGEGIMTLQGLRVSHPVLLQNAAIIELDAFWEEQIGGARDSTAVAGGDLSVSENVRTLSIKFASDGMRSRTFRESLQEMTLVVFDDFHFSPRTTQVHVKEVGMMDKCCHSQHLCWGQKSKRPDEDRGLGEDAMLSQAINQAVMYDGLCISNLVCFELLICCPQPSAILLGSRVLSGPAVFASRLIFPGLRPNCSSGVGFPAQQQFGSRRPLPVSRPTMTLQSCSEQGRQAPGLCAAMQQCKLACIMAWRLAVLVPAALYVVTAGLSISNLACFEGADHWMGMDSRPGRAIVVSAITQQFGSKMEAESRTLNERRKAGVYRTALGLRGGGRGRGRVEKSGRGGDAPAAGQ
jgi:hypothetical protein